jgi:hypothetical protein
MEEQDRHAIQRERKRRRKSRMVIGSKSVFTIQQEIGKRGKAASEKGRNV